MVTPDSTSSSAWGAALQRNDDEAHDRMAERAATTTPELLERKLAVAEAETRALRAAVHRRSALLHTQTVALTERDARISELEDELAAARADLARLVAQQWSLPARVLRRGRSLAGRAARAARIR